MTDDDWTAEDEAVAKAELADLAWRLAIVLLWLGAMLASFGGAIWAGAHDRYAACMVLVLATNVICWYVRHRVLDDD